jgi:tetratricopeptide (TPR) repeat protein/roadblock/LC7 domain-containing protein
MSARPDPDQAGVDTIRLEPPDTSPDAAAARAAAAGREQTLLADSAAAVVLGGRGAPSVPPLTGGSTAGGATPDPAGGLRRGDQLGRFVVLDQLGVGGMGVVYSAYDPHLDRKVAIKLLLAEGATLGARARLLREAQAMARINHPNVITVHEVGVYGDQVYLAMEFADGGTLLAWQAEAKRTRREIIATFLAAGHGLAAAHAAGLIHRDFKPDNVLVTSDGGVRVTDFGIVGVADEARTPRAGSEAERAELLATQSLSGSTPLSQALTRTGSIMGTPLYMAPEQFRGEVATARADQFSFCAALYEALYGERPFAGKDFAALEASVLAGRVSPPPRGSDVPGWLRRALIRGLATDPEARFPSMPALLAELGRDPARQRRRVLAAGGVVAVAAGVFVALSLRSDPAVECVAAADRAAAVWNPARSAAMKTAFAATGKSYATATFLRVDAALSAWTSAWRGGWSDACQATHVRHAQSETLLDARLACLDRRLADARATVDLLVAGGPDTVDRGVKAVDALPAPAACADAEALIAAIPPPEPAVRGAVGAARGELDVARGLERLGRYADALGAARKATASAEATGYKPVIAEALSLSGKIQVSASDAGAFDTLRRAMLAAAAAGDDETYVIATTYLAFQLLRDGEGYSHVRDLIEPAEAIATRTRLGKEAAANLENVAGMMLEAHSEGAAARVRYERALAAAEAASYQAGISMSLNQLGNQATTEGRWADARAAHQRALELSEAVFGPDHPDVAISLNNLGNAVRNEGKLDEALALYERALAIRLAALGPDHEEIGTSYNNLGIVHATKGDPAKAEEYYLKSLAVSEKVWGPTGAQLVPALSNLANIRVDRGDLAGARKYYGRARALLEAARSPDDPMLGKVMSDLGVVAQHEGKLEEAQQMFERAVAIAEKGYGPDHPDVGDALANLTTVLRQRGKLDEALTVGARAIAVMEKAFGPDHARVGMALTNYGNLQRGRDDLDGALASQRRALEIFEAKLGPEHPYVAYPLVMIADVLNEQDKNAEAVPFAERAVAIRVATEARPNDLADAQMIAAYVHVAVGQKKKAIAEATAALEAYRVTDDAAGVADAKDFLKTHR